MIYQNMNQREKDQTALNMTTKVNTTTYTCIIKHKRLSILSFL